MRKSGSPPVLPICSNMGKVRVVCNFPQESIRVGEIARVAAPVGRLPGLGHGAAAGGHLGEQRVHLGRRAHVVRKREAAKTAAFRRKAGIGRQALARPQRQPGFSELEEGDRRRRLQLRQTEAGAITSDGPAAARLSSNPRIWTVLPRPMSSARIHPRRASRGSPEALVSDQSACSQAKPDR